MATHNLCPFYNVPIQESKIEPGDFIVNIHNERKRESEVIVLANGTVMEIRKGMMKTKIFHITIDDWIWSLEKNIGKLLLIKDTSCKYKDLHNVVITK